jgi:TonB family protein
MNVELLAGNIAAHWVQAGVIATSALLAIRLLNFNEPRARLAALHLTLVAIVLLPLMQPWRVDQPALRVTPSAIAIDIAPITSEPAAGEALDTAPWFNGGFAVVAIAAAGVAMRLLWLFYGVIRLARFSRRASEIPRPAVADELQAELGVSPRYIQQIGTRGPWTFGFLRPTVALPEGFDALIAAFQRSVICHELVHVKRRDMAVAFCEELAVAALWFHPWMWLLRARIRVAREQVVDGHVVAMLGNRDAYVRCLVDMSGHDLAPHFSQAGAGMLRPRELRARVDAIFVEVHMSRTRFAIAAFTFVAVTIATTLVAAAAIPLRASSLVSLSPASEAPLYLVSRFLTAGALGKATSRIEAAAPQNAPELPRRQINKTYPEYPQDALESGIRGTVIVDITVNAAGDVTTAAVASGPQELRASAFKAALGLKYTPGPSTTAMKIAVEYTLTGNSWGVRIEDAMANSGTRTMVTQSSGASPDASRAYRVGGNLRPPKKLKDVPPVYPAIAQAARVQGVVILEATIDESGNVSDTRVLRSIPLLDQAAIDAVKQWQYEPTLMNGVAVPIIMTMTVNFSLRELFRIEVTLPNGNVLLTGEMHSNSPVLIDAPGVGRYHFKASRSRDSTDVTVSVFGADGEEHLGNVVVQLEGPVVQAPTTPSFGIRLLNIR